MLNEYARTKSFYKQTKTNYLSSIAEISYNSI